MLWNWFLKAEGMLLQQIVWRCYIESSSAPGSILMLAKSPACPTLTAGDCFKLTKGQPSSIIAQQPIIIRMELPLNSQELLIQRRNVHKNRVDRNRLLLLTLVNVITFLCALFSMAYYRWIHIEIVFDKYFRITPPRYVLWVSLLYVSVEEASVGAIAPRYYLSYAQIQRLICLEQDYYCLALFYELEFVGKLCFVIFSFAFLISTYDVIKIVRFAWKDVVTRSKFFIENNAAAHFKNNFRSVLMISAYLVGMTLNYEAMNLIQTKEYHYGVCFWMFLASLIVLAVAVFYENRKMSELSQEELVLELLQSQKAILRVSWISEESMSDTIFI